MAADIQASLTYIYVDLLKTRNQLLALKQSINATLQEIRQIDRKIEQKRLCLRCGSNYNPAMAADPLELNHLCSNQNERKSIQCEICFIVLPNKQDLKLHQKRLHSQKYCVNCEQFFTQQSLQKHQQTTCSEQKLFCQTCSSKVPRKNISQHVNICSYRDCFKCKQKIYIKAYQYHLKSCKKSKSLITKSKQLGSHKRIFIDDRKKISSRKQISIIPCSIAK